MISRKNIQNVENMGVSPNEYLTKYSIWRVLEKLLQNDVDLQRVYDEISSGLSVNGYVNGNIYNFNDLVWYIDLKKKRLYLLRCIIDNNSTDPIYNNRSFEENGWDCVNEDVDIIALGVGKRIDRLVNSGFDLHEDMEHELGELNDDIVKSTFMKRDMSNRNKNRRYFHFPYTTGFLKQSQENPCILNGSYRLYDNGLIEYDIVYRFGYVGEQDFDGGSATVLTCNNLELKNGSGAGESSGRYNTNQRYFYNSDAYNIFYHENTDAKNYSQIDNTIQMNRNDFVNTYFATINFPIKFKDVNYMIFNGNIMSHISNNQSGMKITPGVSQISYCNRGYGQITMMLITYPEKRDVSWVDGFNAQHGGLGANSFRCKIVGRV